MAGNRPPADNPGGGNVAGDRLAEIGDELMRQRLETWAFAREQYNRHLDAVEAKLPMLAAVIATNRGDRGAIPRLLRSAVPLSGEDRDTLAAFLEGDFAKPVAPGHPKGDARWLATVASDFVSDWKAAAKRAGVTSYGRTPWMREMTIAFYTTHLPRLSAVSTETVLEIMERPKNRRN